MKLQPGLLSKHIAVWLVALSALVAFVGCTEMMGTMRRATYPPSFRYISNAELESVMWRLAGRVHELERLTTGGAAGEEGAAPNVPAIARVLERIEHEARALESEGGGSTHPYFSEQLHTFLGHVQHARASLRHDPPVITSADEVWRACAGCHNRD
ncbi:MAG: hypothetical protein QF570_13370 [Myxococcota bacterium]|jgi:hypothetical protein|nr:hypothetical protein [Myxococcota bacterium]